MLLKKIFYLSLLSLVACSSQPNLTTSTAESSSFSKPLNSTTNNDLLYKLLVAEFALQQNDLSQGLAIYTQLNASLNNIQLAERTAWLAQFSRDKQLALTAAQKWAELSPNDLDAQKNLASQQLQNEKYLPALHQLILVEQLGGQPSFTLYTSFLTNASSSLHQEAYQHLANYQASLKQPSADIEIALAVLARYLNLAPQDATHLAQAQSLNPPVLNSLLTQRQQILAQYLYQQAMQAYAEKNFNLMEAKLKEILSFAPKNATALNALGYTLVDNTNRLEEGYQYIKLAHQQRPDAPEIQDSLGWALFKLNQPAGALVYLQQAYSQLQEDEIAWHLYLVLLHLNKTQAAQEVLTNHPNIQSKVNHEP